MTIRGSNLVPQRGQLPARLSLWTASRCFNLPIYYKPNRKLASMVSASFPFTSLHQTTLCYALPVFPLRRPSPANFGPLIIGPTSKWAEIGSMHRSLWFIRSQLFIVRKRVVYLVFRTEKYFLSSTHRQNLILNRQQIFPPLLT